MGKKDNGKSVSGGGGSGKNGKDGKLAVIGGVPNRDIMQRMNFLWQASVYFERLGSGSGDLGGGVGGASTSGDNEGELVQEKKRRPRRTRKVDGCDLARMYVRTMNVVGQRTTTKMSVISPPLVSSFISDFFSLI
jgi:ribonuclease P protein subunit RPR2